VRKFIFIALLLLLAIFLQISLARIMFFRHCSMRNSITRVNKPAYLFAVGVVIPKFGIIYSLHHDLLQSFWGQSGC